MPRSVRGLSIEMDVDRTSWMSYGEPRAAPYDTAAAADSDHRERID
jgi:hypothetical protein